MIFSPTGMDNARLEKRVLEICDAVKRGSFGEDAFVELKAEFTPAERAARQLAAHANAARSQPILWLIGVDEKAKSIVGAKTVELANWVPQVESKFDEAVFPQLVQNLNVHVDGATVVALFFDTSRPPYLVNSQSGREILWRVGNRTDVPRRSDLIRLLVPTASLPVAEVVDAELRCLFCQGGTFCWEFDGRFYLRASSQFSVSLPMHSCSAKFGERPSKIVMCPVNHEFDEVKLMAASHAERRTEFSAADPISSDGYQVVVRGSGMLRITAKMTGPRWTNGYPDRALVEFRIVVPEADGLPLVIAAPLRSPRREPSGNLTWTIDRE